MKPDPFRLPTVTPSSRQFGLHFGELVADQTAAHIGANRGQCRANHGAKMPCCSKVFVRRRRENEFTSDPFPPCIRPGPSHDRYARMIFDFRSMKIDCVPDGRPAWKTWNLSLSGTISSITASD